MYVPLKTRVEQLETIVSKLAERIAILEQEKKKGKEAIMNMIKIIKEESHGPN